MSAVVVLTIGHRGSQDTITQGDCKFLLMTENKAACQCSHSSNMFLFTEWITAGRFLEILTSQQESKKIPLPWGIIVEYQLNLRQKWDPGE